MTAEQEANDKLDQNKDTFMMLDGSNIEIHFEDTHFKNEYRDEYTTEVLPRHLVREAMVNELQYFNAKVWKGVHPGAQRSETPPIRVRWVLCNKGDAARPEIRARLVACEIKTYEDTTGLFYASTPPLEAKRVLLSELATKRFSNGKPLQLSFVDVTKAYFNGVPRRDLRVRFPPEMGLGHGMTARLHRCMYGTRDADSV